MSLIFAEGFEHFHPSAMNLAGLAPNFMIGYRSVASWETSYAHVIGMALNKEANFNRNRIVHNARKGGKAIGIEPHSALGNLQSWAVFGIKVKKSRSLFLGFAMKVPRGKNTFQMVVAFGRSKERRPFQDLSGNHNAKMNVMGGCHYRNRETNYADLEWHFNGQSPVYRQIHHNRNIVDNDWHYFEFGTTVYGNVVSDPQGWGECRVGRVENIASNIFTAVPGGVDESFLDMMWVAVSDVGDVNFDDIYVCNDEGTVNNTFLSSIFVRPMKTSHSGNLFESVSVGATQRHEAVGPHLVGDETTLPVPLPTPEEDPNFVPWGNPAESHLILPREGNRQTFRMNHVDFMGSNPRMHGVVATVFAGTNDPNVSRAALIPIKTIGGGSHTYYDPTSDMVPLDRGPRQLIFENPNAHGVIDEGDPHWSVNAVNNSEYGFRVDPVVEQVEMEKDWNPALLRYPVFHENLIEESLGLGLWVERYIEELVDESFDAEDYSRWDWACPIYEDLEMFDEPGRIRASYVTGWSNMRIEDSHRYPEEYIRDGFGLESHTQVDAVTTIYDEITAYDTSYHEWVEQLTVWLDPYDFTDRDWGATALDGIDLEVTDIFDNHFEIDDEMVAESDIWSNQCLAEDYMGLAVHAQDGIVLPAIEDEFGIEADHHDGNWVEQFTELFGLDSSILTRHWRFEIFWFVCVSWWQIGPIEQPLEYWESNPCDVKNDNITEAYKAFFGGYYEEVYAELESQWIALGGDPAMLENDIVRWSQYDTMVFDGMGNLIDMVDSNGISIFGDLL